MPFFSRLGILLLLSSSVVQCCAQQTSGTQHIGNRAQPADSSNVFCLEPADTSAVNAAVDLCLDRLVKTDVQELPGTRVNLSILPADDPELLAIPVPIQPARVPQASSWKPQTEQSGSLDRGPELQTDQPAALQLPPLPITGWSDNTDTNFSELSRSGIQQKLARATIRAQEEEQRRRWRNQQNSFHHQCSRLHMSDLECRLGLRQQHLSALSHPTARKREPRVISDR
jgi:hypothetical protein